MTDHTDHIDVVSMLTGEASKEDLEGAANVLERVRDEFLLCDGPTQGSNQTVVQQRSTEKFGGAPWFSATGALGEFICLWEAATRALDLDCDWKMTQDAAAATCTMQPISSAEQLAISILYHEGYTAVWNDCIATLEEIPEAPFNVAKKLREIAGERSA